MNYLLTAIIVCLLLLILPAKSSAAVDTGANYPNGARIVGRFDGRGDALTVYGTDAARLLNLKGDGANDRASIRKM